MAQIIPIVSDALQATIRRLLPSQNGFGEDLQASNVIVPVVNVTPSAEGSILGTNLQTALAFGSQTAFDVTGATTTIANSPGFYRVFGTIVAENATSSAVLANFTLDDGSTTKIIYGVNISNDATKTYVADSYDFNVFLAAGETLKAVSSSSIAALTGSVRQIATVSGIVVNPAGFTAE